MILEKVYDELMAQIEDLKKAIAGGSGGTSNYNELDNRPYINSKLLTGNKNSKQIGVAEYITSEDYSDLESPSEHEIYFVSDRPEVVNWGTTYQAGWITWTEGEGEYTATVSFATGSDGVYYKSVLDASVNDAAITIESTEIEYSPTPGINLSLSCDDPGAITETSLRFTVDFAAETGAKKIIHNGMTYGSKFDVLDNTARTSTGDYSITGNFSDYDFIGASFYTTAGSGNSYGGYGQMYIPNLAATDHADFDGSFYIPGGRNDRWIQLKIKDDTHYTIVAMSSGVNVKGIYGIKF